VYQIVLAPDAQADDRESSVAMQNSAGGAQAACDADGPAGAQGVRDDLAPALPCRALERRQGR
jgi:hypothetical protein